MHSCILIATNFVMNLYHKRYCWMFSCKIFAYSIICLYLIKNYTYLQSFGLRLGIANNINIIYAYVRQITYFINSCIEVTSRIFTNAYTTLKLIGHASLEHGIHLFI